MAAQTRLRRAFAWAELPERKDVYVWKGTTRYGNHDLYPIPPSERTYGLLAYIAYWTTNGLSLSTFVLGSSYIAYGLTAGQCIGAVFVGAVISSFIGYLAARPGMDYSMGYTVMNRAAYGLNGILLPIGFMFISGMVFAGMQAYYGALSVVVILSAIIPQFNELANTLPLSAAITTKELIGFLIYTAMLIPVLLWVPAHQLRKCLYPSFVAILATLVGITAWACIKNGGTGSLISSSVSITGGQRAFRMVQCMSSVGGTWGAAAERISDWTRFERKRGVSTPAMIFTLPITVTFSAILGVLTATATSQIYGESIWNPLLLLQQIQTSSYTPAVRAGTFFAGCGLLSCEVFLQVSQNSIPYGMDLAGLFPRYVSMKRGAIFLTLCTLLIQPWRFYSQASIFVNILSGLTIFFAASMAVVVADFWIVRKRLWKVPDLFEECGIYWFTSGWNLRCVAALFIGMIPSVPGFIMVCINADANNAWVEIYQITYFVAAPLSLVSYLIFNYIWPVEGLGIEEMIPTEEEYLGVIEGVEYATSEDVKTPKTVSIEKTSELFDI